MSERKRNLAVGLTTLLGILGVIGMILIFGYLPSFMRTGYPVQINLPRAAGLHENSAIFLSGIVVGTVERVELREPAGVTVYARIHDRVKIPTNARPSVTQPLIGGSASIEFNIEPGQEATTFLARNGEATIDGDIPSLTMSVDRVVGNLERVSQNFEALSQEWTRVGHSINQLVEMRKPEDVDAGATPANLATILQRTDKRLAELESVLKGIERYTSDEKLHDDIRTTAANARATTDKLSGSLDDIQQRYVALADRLAAAADSARALMTTAREGEGTLGRALNDPALYNNLNDTVQRAQATLDEARLLIQKWKAEGLPVQF